MRITFRSQGGIAFFPGLNEPVVIDTEKLSGEQRSKLEGLVQAARFFALPPTVGTNRRGAADLREYALTVDDGVRNYTVRVTEPFENFDLAELIMALQSHARAQLRSAPTKKP